MPVRNDFLAAQTYDQLYAHKDVPAEAEAANRVISALAPAAATLLDVGCGTGRHVEHFRRWYACEGVDIDPGLIALARKRCPGVPFHVAGMATFDLPRRFDSIVSFGGALAYVGAREALRPVLARILSHLEPGGVVVIELWYSPQSWPGWEVKADFIDEPERKIARIGRATRRDDVVTLEFEYLLGTPEHIDHFGRTSQLALLEPEDYLGCFADLGLGAERMTTAAGDFVVGHLEARHVRRTRLPARSPREAQAPGSRVRPG